MLNIQFSLPSPVFSLFYLVTFFFLFPLCIYTSLHTRRWDKLEISDSEEEEDVDDGYDDGHNPYPSKVYK